MGSPMARPKAWRTTLESSLRRQGDVNSYRNHMGMDQYLLIPFLMGWTSIYQLFWCSPGVQGFDTLPYGGFHKKRATPSSHPAIRLGFSMKWIEINHPASYWGIPMTLETHHMFRAVFEISLGSSWSVKKTCSKNIKHTRWYPPSDVCWFIIPMKTI